MRSGKRRGGISGSRVYNLHFNNKGFVVTRISLYDSFMYIYERHFMTL